MCHLLGTQHSHDHPQSSVTLLTARRAGITSPSRKRSRSLEKLNAGSRGGGRGWARGHGFCLRQPQPRLPVMLHEQALQRPRGLTAPGSLVAASSGWGLGPETTLGNVEGERPREWVDG